MSSVVLAARRVGFPVSGRPRWRASCPGARGRDELAMEEKREMGREGIGGGSMGSRAFLMSCLGGRPHYPSMPRYPKKPAGVLAEGGADLEARPEPEKRVALLTVLGMTCAACAGSVEKAIKRLPGIHDAAVDVLNDRAQVVFYPAFVSVSSTLLLLFCPPDGFDGLVI
ncbi:hypothetical protein GW17_00062365 [Ensete ventricosum]|nr:hypothetical protein GW17_00062365 [Ensete ventricosum]